MSDQDELTALILPLLPYSTIPEQVDASAIAGVILARWRLVPIPKGHIRERIDPRRDIEPRGPVRCTKCATVVARYAIGESRQGDLTVTYETAFISKQPCID